MSLFDRHILDLEAVTHTLFPDEPPTWAFFATEWFNAAAGHGNQTTAEVIKAVDDVEQVIVGFDKLRRERRLDVIYFAMVLHRSFAKKYGDERVAQTADAIADTIVRAYFHWDKERYGEDNARDMLRNRGQFEAAVAGRIAAMKST